MEIFMKYFKLKKIDILIKKMKFVALNFPLAIYMIWAIMIQESWFILMKSTYLNIFTTIYKQKYALRPQESENK